MGLDELSSKVRLLKSILLVVTRFLFDDFFLLRDSRLYRSHTKSDARAANVKNTAKMALSNVKGTLMPIWRSSSQANIATK
jgi:hypothetical protein